MAISMLYSGMLLTSGIFGLQQLLSTSNESNYYSEIEDLKPAQKQALEALKTSMSPVLPHQFMKEDIYLIKFLQFHNFNIAKAEQHLQEVLNWRADNNVDDLIENPPSYFEELQREYPVYNDGFDREGRPICEIPFGGWNMRKAATTGIIKNVTLQVLVNCYEKASIRVREQQAKGINVTQWIVIANMEGYSVADHLCPSCLSGSVNFAEAIDKYNPNSSAGFWLINTPSTWFTLFKMARPVMSPGTRAVTIPFTSDEAIWKPFLEERVDFNEISDWYGGAKSRQ